MTASINRKCRHYSVDILRYGHWRRTFQKKSFQGGCLYDTTTTEAEHLLDLLVSTLQRTSNGRISLEMCHGQRYDGASNMRGHQSGLQTRVRATQPKALSSY